MPMLCCCLRSCVCCCCCYKCLHKFYCHLHDVEGGDSEDRNEYAAQCMLHGLTCCTCFVLNLFVLLGVSIIFVLVLRATLRGA